jgi:uncharacterized protein
MSTCTAFKGNTLLASGSQAEVALAIKQAGDLHTILAFDDATGRVIDFNVRGSDADIAARYTPRAEVRGPGRPKLGVVSREVTLLPRHWEWLAAQPGGASVVLRRLVDQERRSTKQHRRAAHEAAYKFMSAIAGDLPGFEEATRALFADNRTRFEDETAKWPPDIRAYALNLAQLPTS